MEHSSDLKVGEVVRGTLIGAVNLTGVAEPGKSVSPWHNDPEYGWQLVDSSPSSHAPWPASSAYFNVYVTPSEREAVQQCWARQQGALLARGSSVAFLILARPPNSAEGFC